MPFTIAHAAAAIPFSRVRFLPLPALVIGTVVPDLPMFLPAGPSYASTHALSTAVPVGVPLGLLLLVGFEQARAPFIALLPHTLRRRLSLHATAQWVGSARELGLVSVSLTIGILTHIVWDAFTHQGLWGASLLELDRIWLRTETLSLPGYKVLQYICSVGGLICVAWSSWQWIHKQPLGKDVEHQFSSRARCVLAVGLVLLVPLACAFRAWHVASRGSEFWHTFAFELATVVVALEAALIVAARGLLGPVRQQEHM